LYSQARRDQKSSTSPTHRLYINDYYGGTTNERLNQAQSSPSGAKGELQLYSKLILAFKKSKSSQSASDSGRSA
jgi:hypothetical protein